MTSPHKALRILYNGSLSLFQPDTVIAQGGPSRFEDIFRKFFLKEKDFLIIPFLFTQHADTKDPFIRTTTFQNHLFNELVYCRDSFGSLYGNNPKRSQFLKQIHPLLNVIRKTISDEGINVVFLNGFSLNNWLLLYAAHKEKIPVVIQHAGLFKKEIARNKGLSSATKKLFYQMERDTIRWCSHHIFLNKFSKEVFMKLYNIKNQSLCPSSIIPLPVPLVRSSNNFKSYVNVEANIGMVARWDSIKNHSAMYRLATASLVPKEWKFHTVVNIPKTSNVYTFPKKYTAAITTHRPMVPKDLTHFYQKMDAIFVPSNFDVSPTVVAEAFLAGVPVIISNKVGWQNEFIECGLRDHVIAINSSGNTLVKTVGRILSERQGNIKKYRGIAKHIRETHAPKRVFEQYNSLFRKIMACV
jgi:glycosyltransferase involved in cell wall biosynthesis